MTASLIDQAADYAELKSSEHRLMVQRAFMAGALAVLECINNWDDYTEVAIHEGEPSHWMPLPAPPVWMPLPAPPVSA